MSIGAIIEEIHNLVTTIFILDIKANQIIYFKTISLLCISLGFVCLILKNVEKRIKSINYYKTSYYLYIMPKSIMILTTNYKVNEIEVITKAVISSAVVNYKL